MLTPGANTYADMTQLTEILIDLGHGSYLDARDQLALESDARQAVLYLDRAYEWIGVRSVAGQSLA